jgi:cyclohexyl-isocyanide hydratase
MLVFPGITQLDATGPCELFASLPDTEVCLIAKGTAPILGAAGLLRGHRATTHWLALEFLEAFGAIPVSERVVVDRNRITGGGVTAGIDLALVVAAELVGPTAARKSQLYLEYAPAPPFSCGSPASAPPELVHEIRADARPRQDARRSIVERAAARLGPFRPGV